MDLVEKILGRLPVYKGDYIIGMWYKHLNRVTFCGSEFQAKKAGYLHEPLTINEDGVTVTFNTAEWDVISNGTDAFLVRKQIQRNLIITESKWEETQQNPTMLNEFYARYTGWTMDVVADDTEIVDPVDPEEEPTPSDVNASVIGNRLKLTGTIVGNRLIVVGTIKGNRLVIQN